MKLLSVTGPVIFIKDKHGRRCRWCHKNLKDRDLAYFERYQVEKFYPVKGIMRFRKHAWFHKECYIHQEDQRRSHESEKR